MAVWAVCPRCEGEGKHTNPAIDGNGLTGEDIDRLGGDDFLEQYMEGAYDVPCERCKGQRVVKGCIESDCSEPTEFYPWGEIAHCYTHLLNSEEELLSSYHQGLMEQRAEERMMGSGEW